VVRKAKGRRGGRKWEGESEKERVGGRESEKKK